MKVNVPAETTSASQERSNGARDKNMLAGLFTKSLESDVNLL